MSCFWREKNLPKDGCLMKKMLFVLYALFLTSSSLFATENYSNVKTAGNFLYVSAQFPIDPVTGKLVHGNMGELTDITLDHIQYLLHNKGFKMSDVVKTEVYLTDIRDYEDMDAAYGERFPYQYPPTRDVVVSKKLLNNATIQISCIAYKN